MMATRKQKAAAARITDNHGNVSKTMLEVGYSPNTAKKPSNLTESRGWKELVTEQLPDGYLLEKHRQFLEEPKKVSSFRKGEKETEIEEWTATAVKALDMAYKLKGSYAPEKTISVNIDIEPSDKIKDLAKRLRDATD